jgi:hypothetical protein
MLPVVLRLPGGKGRAIAHIALLRIPIAGQLLYIAAR